MKGELALPTSAAQLALTPREQAQLKDAVRGAWSPSTMKAYRADWADFEAWVAERPAHPVAMPASPTLVALYLVSLADKGKKASTITRRAAAIATLHRIKEQPNPCDSEAVKRTLSGLRRKLGVRPDKRRPLVFDVLKSAVDTCDVKTNRGLRDRALLLFGYATALRRENLVQLRVSDITYVQDGLTVFVAKGKTDQEGHGRTVGVVRSGGKLCAVEAVRTWVSKLNEKAPLFRRVGRDDKIHDAAMSPDGVADAVKRCLREAGIDPAKYAAHSMRAGHATQAARAGALPQEIMELGGWKRLDTVMGYIREADPTRHTSATKIWPKGDE